MKFLIDEDEAVEIARSLRQAGHQVRTVAEVLGTSAEDPDVWQEAARNREIVITCNRQDFLQFAGTAPVTGLNVLKRRKTRQAECGNILQLIGRAGEPGLSGNINFC